MTSWNINLDGYDKAIKESKTEINLTELESLKSELAKKDRKIVRLSNKIRINETLIATLNSSTEEWKNDYTRVLSQSKAKDNELNSLQSRVWKLEFRTLPEWLAPRDIIKNQILIFPYNNSLWLFSKLNASIKHIRFDYSKHIDKIYPLKGTYKFPKNIYIGLNISDNIAKKDGLFLIDSDNQIIPYNTAHSTDGGAHHLCATYKTHINSIEDYMHAIFYIRMEFETINLGSPYPYKEFTQSFRDIFNKILIEAIQFAPNEAMNGEYLRTSGESSYGYYRHLRRSELIIREEEMEEYDDEDDDEDDDEYYDEDE